MTFQLPEFQKYFLEHYVGCPLETGDGIFFNPALFHAAGENHTSKFERSTNLSQVSSAFRKPMECVETLALVDLCWEDLTQKYKVKGMNDEVRAFVAAFAECYPFPTDLDHWPLDRRVSCR